MPNTRDFILKTLARELKGHPFAEFAAHLLEAIGYRTRVSPPGPDGGIDIIAHKDELGFEPPIIKVQVKSVEESIGAPQVQALFGNVEQTSGEFGLFITLGSFTNQAITFARSKSNLRLDYTSHLKNRILVQDQKERCLECAGIRLVPRPRPGMKRPGGFTDWMSAEGQW